MRQDKIKVKLGGVSETLLFPLWARALVSKEYSSLFYDAKAIELVEKIDYNFSASDMSLPVFRSIMSNISCKGNLLSLMALVAKQFDDKIKVYITGHPRASVVNIGAGLDATFYRVDNGTIRWYDVDLPAVIDVRRQLLPEPHRVTYIAKSLLDPSWCKDIKHSEEGVFMIASEVLQFFEEPQVKKFFSMLSDNFPDGEIVFTSMSRSDGGFREWIDMFPPEQRVAIGTAWIEALKDWWKKAPQDRKDKLSTMISALEIPSKPNGREWADLEAWWNQLCNREKEGVVRDLMTALHGGSGMWRLEDANEITKWDNRITVLDQFPMFKNIPRDSLSADTRRLMNYSDESRRSSIFHLRV